MLTIAEGNCYKIHFFIFKLYFKDERKKNTNRDLEADFASDLKYTDLSEQRLLININQSRFHTHLEEEDYLDLYLKSKTFFSLQDYYLNECFLIKNL